MLTLRELRQHDSFLITLKGTTQKSYPTNSPCLYFEWAYGEKNGAEWAMFVKGYQSSDRLTLATEWGELTLDVNQLRLYLAPAYSHTYSDLAEADVPEPLREMMHDERKPITIEEYRLTEGTPYYAQVNSESYWLPPEGEGQPPSRHVNHVLAISDLPFDAQGKSPHPLTPVYQGWSY